MRNGIRSGEVDDVEDSANDDDDWVPRRDRSAIQGKGGRSQPSRVKASKKVPRSAPMWDDDEEDEDQEAAEEEEEERDDNPFASYRHEVAKQGTESSFVIPKRRTEDSSHPPPATTMTSSIWQEKRPKIKEIDMSPTLRFGVKRSDETKPVAVGGGGGGAKANGASKKKRLRRPRDEDSDSDSNASLVSPAASGKVTRPATDDGDDDDIVVLDDRKSDGAGGRGKKRVRRPRGSIGASSDEDLSLSDGEGGRQSKQRRTPVKQSRDADKEEVVLLDEEEEAVEPEKEEDDDEEEEEEEEAEEEARVQKHMQKILRDCEQISERLMEELRTWSKKDAADASGAGKPSPSDRIGLTSMDDEQKDEGPTSRHSRKTHRVPVDVVSQICPDVILKPYQLVGVQWLYLTYQLGVSGVLADEMGLGKTVQTIVFLSYLCHIQPGQTHLIIVPASVLSNWELEFTRFAPKVKVLRYHGSAAERAAIRDDYQRSARRQGSPPWDVIITTYTYWERNTGGDDRTFFKKMDITYLVLDEGHSVKNLQSQRFRRLRSQPSTHRLVLSGTPVQNAVRELLVLMHFLMPEVFNFGDHLESFFSFISGGSTDENDQAGLMKLRRLLTPFVLRRLKQDVLDQLTEKTSEVLLLPMHETQAQIYNSIRDQHMARILSRAKERQQHVDSGGGGGGAAAGGGTEEGGSESRMLRSVRAELAELLRSSAVSTSIDDKDARNVFHDFRKAANHPLLLRRYYDDDKLREIGGVLQGAGHFGEACSSEMVQRELEGMNDFDINDLCDEYSRRLGRFQLDPETLFQSCKFCKLRDLLPKLLGAGHRILLFSQWTKILDMLEELMERLDVNYLRLDGSTPINERQELIDSFNEEGSEFSVFLLSTRAGGLGLNLTGADTVILHDSDWNPTVDRQAEDRCHRIGQTKPVRVYRLVTVGTVDERVYEIASAKLERSEVLLDNKDEGVGDGSEDEDGGGNAAPLTIASLVRAELEKYVMKESNGGGTGSSNTSPSK